MSCCSSAAGGDIVLDGGDTMNSELTPAVKPHLSQQVRSLAQEYKVSERTARRYLKRGQLPPLPNKPGCKIWEVTRRTGADGKQYPVRQSSRSPLHGLLSSARSNVRRAGRAEEFYDDDVIMLRQIVSEAQNILHRWGNL